MLSADQKITMNRLPDGAPIGAPCIVVKDDGTLFFSKTYSVVEYRRGLSRDPTKTTAVVFVEGIAGYYMADRVYDASGLLK